MTIIATGGHVTFRSLVPYARRPTDYRAFQCWLALF